MNIEGIGGKCSSTFFYQTDLGKIGISEQRGKITNLYFANDERPLDVDISETPVLKELSKVIMMNLYIYTAQNSFSIVLSRN